MYCPWTTTENLGFSLHRYMSNVSGNLSAAHAAMDHLAQVQQQQQQHQQQHHHHHQQQQQHHHHQQQQQQQHRQQQHYQQQRHYEPSSLALPKAAAALVLPAPTLLSSAVVKGPGTGTGVQATGGLRGTAASNSISESNGTPREGPAAGVVPTTAGAGREGTNRAAAGKLSLLIPLDLYQGSPENGKIISARVKGSQRIGPSAPIAAAAAAAAAVKAKTGQGGGKPAAATAAAAAAGGVKMKSAEGKKTAAAVPAQAQAGGAPVHAPVAKSRSKATGGGGKAPSAAVPAAAAAAGTKAEAIQGDGKPAAAAPVGGRSAEAIQGKGRGIARSVNLAASPEAANASSKDTTGLKQTHTKKRVLLAKSHEGQTSAGGTLRTVDSASTSPRKVLANRKAAAPAPAGVTGITVVAAVTPPRMAGAEGGGHVAAPVAADVIAGSLTVWKPLLKGYCYHAVCHAWERVSRGYLSSELRTGDQHAQYMAP